MFDFKIDNDSILTDKQIKEIVQRFNNTVKLRLDQKLLYYKGDNQSIKYNRVNESTSGAPDYHIAVPYARKIVDTAAGYMYKPGNIKYQIENTKYKKIFEDINKANQEVLRTSVVGKYTGIYGVGYELHYIDPEGDKANPMFYPVDPREIIPVWNYDINPELALFLRTYKKSDIVAIDVYYKDHTDQYEYTIDGSNAWKDFRQTGTAPNFYKKPPLVVYRNNEDSISDFDPIIDLIDAYDVLMSDAMNEIDRFAWAYLLLAGQVMDAEDAKAVKIKRMFENLESTDQVKFLTKDINSEFFSMMKEWVKDEIHKQSHIPDFLDVKTGAQTSGAALDRLLFDFEFIAATKEMYFKQGLYDRYKLIDQIVNFTDSDYIVDDIKIVMDRNKPTDKEVDARVYNAYYGKGITDVTLMGYAAKFVEDPEAEKKAFDEDEDSKIEKMPYMENTGEDNGQIEDDNRTDEQVSSESEQGTGAVRQKDQGNGNGTTK